MGVIIGMDEAGLGPNLGPFVVAATIWQVPDPATSCDLFEILDDVVSSEPCPNGRLHVADSKQVYSPARGLAALETAALILLRMANCHHAEFPGVLSGLSRFSDHDDWMTQEPVVPLPTAAESERINELASQLADSMERCGVRCLGIHLDAVFPARFNRHLNGTDNKAATCSEISLDLLKAIWNPDETPAFVIADRHGGRARYDQLLSRTFDDRLPMRISETAELSRYRLGESEVRFECRAERHFAVACASIVAKYVRELSMRMFNAYWQKHVPGVKPTAGYPGDSKRFATDVEETRRRMGIPDCEFWRER